jgi:Predicted secreted protein containing a PDZ domain
LTRQTWTATLSAILFVLLAAVIALVPVPYVTWAPGATHDLLGQVDGKDAITITGVPTKHPSGKLRLTTVAVTSPGGVLSLPEALISYWLPSREVLPRDVVYRPGVSDADLTSQEAQLMTDSQTTAVVAALRAARVPVTEMPMIAAVLNSGPANGILKPGDLIEAVDNRHVETTQDVTDAVRDRNVGESVSFTYFRDGQRKHSTIVTRATEAAPKEPIIGAKLAIGYSYAPKVSFAVDPTIGGSSAGLMFSIAIYSMLSEQDLIGGRDIAGTGTVDADGRVGAIGGIQEKLAAAARDQSTIFLMPRANCVDLAAIPNTISAVAVDNLGDAVSALQGTGVGALGTVTGCR